MSQLVTLGKRNGIAQRVGQTVGLREQQAVVVRITCILEGFTQLADVEALHAAVSQSDVALFVVL
jgi:hypothetical protein